MSKIGILTLPFGPNYGMNLQVYALQTSLQNLGHEVLVINRKWNRINSNSGLIAAIKRYFYYKIICRKIFSFYRRNIHVSTPCYTSEEIALLCKAESLDYVVVGSDQVWRIENTRGANLDFFGGFMKYNSTVKLLSYAASFGNDSWAGTDEETKSISVLLKNFEGISVREDSGMSLCKKQFGVDVVKTLDPTFLLDKKDYPLNNNARNRNQNNIVSYILDYNEAKRNIIQSIGNQKGVDSYYALYPEDRTKYSIYKYSVEDWLSYINNATFVVTDSFHGMVFSILFEKDFLVIGNEKRGMERFTSLLNSLSLENRLIINLNEFDISIANNAIDYDEVYVKLGKLRNESVAFLTQYLREKK